jgi:TPP-dependent pyruvate/acetoin dehydrogenase alpha subunit
MRRYKVTVTTAADGSATAYTPRVAGRVEQIEYVKGDFADGVDFTITGEATGVGLWTESNVNASAVRAPRQPAHSQVGAALLYAAGGTAVTDRIALASDRIKIVIAQGGAAKTGVFHVLIDEG